MRPGQNFHIVNEGKTSFDEETFSKLYLPILGKTAATLYQLLRVTNSGRLSALMEYLNVGLSICESAFDKLSAMSLLNIYDNPTDYSFELRSPLTYEQFLADNFYVHLLISKIGAENVARLKPNKPSGQLIKRKFSEVFPLTTEEMPQALPIALDRLDLTSFKQLMDKEKFDFVNESRDILHLYNIADKFDLDWYALFKLAEETANSDRTINTFAMIRKLVSSQNPLPAVDRPYQELVRVAKSVSPDDFLRQLKRQVGGFVSQDEVKLLAQLKRQKLSADVQNILIHYVLIQQKNSSLTSAYVNRLANDWLRHKIDSAETAVQYLTEFEKKTSKPKKKSATKVEKSLPDWAREPYIEKTDAQERAKFEAYKARKKEQKGAD